MSEAKTSLSGSLSAELLEKIGETLKNRQDLNPGPIYLIKTSNGNLLRLYTAFLDPYDRIEKKAPIPEPVEYYILAVNQEGETVGFRFSNLGRTRVQEHVGDNYSVALGYVATFPKNRGYSTPIEICNAHILQSLADHKRIIFRHIIFEHEPTTDSYKRWSKNFGKNRKLRDYRPSSNNPGKVFDGSFLTELSREERPAAGELPQVIVKTTQGINLDSDNRFDLFEQAFENLMQKLGF